MFYYFPSTASIVILAFDIVFILLFVMVSKTRPSQRVGGFVLISILLIPFLSLKFLPSIDFLKSTPGKLTVINNSQLYSPVYYMNNNGNIIWIFLTIKNIPVSKVFDIEGRILGMLVVKKDGKYGYVNFKYENYKANVEINESNLQFDRDGSLSDFINHNTFPIIANYTSNLLTILFLIFILYRILFFLFNKIRTINTKNIIREN